ncbi:MAG: MarR family winged helix-turn-helix transcriptional regulator [Ruminococcus sp.]|nr:MarR family winged helix-turn-helix transcriptional regulator [Ruminococcus sp.]
MDYKSIRFEIFTFMNLMKRKMNASGEKCGMNMLTMPNAKLIVYLFQNLDKNIYQKDLEEEFMLRASTISRSLKILEKQGFIIRSPSVYDSRLKKISLTEKSLKISDYYENALNNVFKKLTANIPEEELNSFFNTLGKMKMNLTDSR